MAASKEKLMEITSEIREKATLLEAGIKGTPDEKVLVKLVGEFYKLCNQFDLVAKDM